MKSNNNGIWDFEKYFSYKIEQQYRLTDHEGHTELRNYPDLAKKLGISNLYIKREDLNPTGSHKDRSLAYQISFYYQQGKRDFVISSSGNAVISAINYCKHFNSKLYVFISPKTPRSKLERIEKVYGEDIFSKIDYQISNSSTPIASDRIAIKVTDRAVSDAFKFARDHNYVLLRGSTDPIAVEGFKTLGIEIAQQLPDATQIFLPVSSGTTLSGIFQGYKELQNDDKDIAIPQLHIVQSSAVNPMARHFDEKSENSEDSIAQAIVDKVAHRETEVVEQVKMSEGSGWIISDNEMLNAEKLLNQEGIICSIEGAMALAALIKAINAGWKIEKPVCIITGTENHKDI